MGFRATMPPLELDRVGVQRPRRENEIIEERGRQLDGTADLDVSALVLDLQEVQEGSEIGAVGPNRRSAPAACPTWREIRRALQAFASNSKAARKFDFPEPLAPIRTFRGPSSSRSRRRKLLNPSIVRLLIAAMTTTAYNREPSERLMPGRPGTQMPDPLPSPAGGRELACRQRAVEHRHRAAPVLDERALQGSRGGGAPRRKAVSIYPMATSRFVM